MTGTPNGTYRRAGPPYSSTGETTSAVITVTTAASNDGDIAFDGGGQAIYLFDKEPGTTPDCYGDCAAAA
ncbi:MAG: hypothetical protein ABJD68_11485 [Nakamurella sp.]